MIIGGIAPWYGAKRRKPLCDAIICELGTDHRGFLDGCCGSLAVLMAKEPVSMEVAIDLNGDLVNLARVIASDRYMELQERACRTLVCSEIYTECRELWTKESEAVVAPSIDQVDDDHVDAAYRFLVASWQGINGVSGTCRGNAQLARRYTVGGGHGSTRWRGVIESIPDWHQRLLHVLIDRIDICVAIEKLKDDGTWVVYLDPPYYRKSDKYVHDFTPAKHAELCAVCSSKKNTRFVISYYDEPEVRELYRSWTVVDCSINKALLPQGMRDSEGDEPVIAPEILLINGPSYVEPGLFGTPS